MDKFENQIYLLFGLVVFAWVLLKRVTKSAHIMIYTKKLKGQQKSK